MNIVIIFPTNMKEEYHFIMYLLTYRLNCTCSYLNSNAKPEHNRKITHTSNKKIPEIKYNINIRAVGK